jgi:TolA-binding protein
MELQDAPATYLFKLWPWLEANKIRIASGAGILLVAAGAIYFYSWQQNEKEINAGMELTQLMLADSRGLTPAQQAVPYLKIAREYPGTGAGQRAFLQNAALLFEAGQYPEAQTQFQQFLQQYPDSFFSGQAALGLAASLDAQKKLDLAAGAYQRVLTGNSDPLAANYAKFSLAQIKEQQGKLTEALSLYDEVYRSVPNSQMGSQAGLRAMELKVKQPSAAPASTAPAPFKLNP